MTFTPNFRPDFGFAGQLEEADPLNEFVDHFYLPWGEQGKRQIYFCGHSLGLLPRGVHQAMQAELDKWARFGVEGHFHGDNPWYRYPELLRAPMARLVGALPSEVVLMNGLTINLHLMMETFYRPNDDRSLIVIDEPTFPSDRYAITSQLERHGCGIESLRTATTEAEIEAILDREGQNVSLIFLSAVNFLTGAVFDVPRLARAARKSGCLLGLDLAHAVGNVPLALHDWDVDFAVWCSYKYLNGGPGAVAGVFVHDRHGSDTTLPRLAGWWGNDPTTRFRMQLEPNFIPMKGADGWQVSNPPILALVPLRCSLATFDQATMPRLRKKSLLLTGYLLDLLESLNGAPFEVLTPLQPERRGCQVSLRLRDRASEVQKELQRAGVVADFREPDVLRVAPVPLYNTFSDVWHFVRILSRERWHHG